MRAPYLLLALAACGSDPSSPPAPAPPLRVVAAAPAAGTAVHRGELTLPAPAERLGRSAAGVAIVVMAGEVHELIAGAPVARQLYASDQDPRALGAVRAVAPRMGGGAWIAAENGLFRLDGAYVTHVPIDAVARLSDVSEAPSGALAGLWLSRGDGVWRRAASGALESLTVDGVPLAADQIAVETAGDAALVALRDAPPLVVAPDEAGVLVVEPAPFGAVRAVAAGPGVLWAAGDAGLFRWRAGDAPRWTQLTLAAEGSAPTPVLALAADGNTGDAWARTAHQVVRASPDGVLTALGAEVDGPALITVDGGGDAWLADGARLTRVALDRAEAAVSFARDVKPWIQRSCAACHSNATADYGVYAVFAARADDALARVRSGDMPRCAGGLPCTPAERLAPADYLVLEQWVRQGKPE